MQRSQKILIGVGTGVLAVTVVAATIGPIVYRDFIAPPAAHAPTLGSNSDLLGDPSAQPDSADAISPSGAPLDAASLAGAWTVGGDSEAGYRVDEVLNGAGVTVTGRTPDVTGTLTINPTGTALEAAALTVDVASIETGSSSRDAYFRDRALRVDEYPTATFVLTSPVAFDALPASGATAEAQATGDLTIAGVTHSVTADVSVRSDGKTAQIAGTIPVAFADFGVDAPSLGFVEVEPTGFVEFQLTATR